MLFKDKLLRKSLQKRGLLLQHPLKHVLAPISISVVLLWSVNHVKDTQNQPQTVSIIIYYNLTHHVFSIGMSCECSPNAVRTNDILMYMPVCEPCTTAGQAPSRDGLKCVGCSSSNLEISTAEETKGMCIASADNFALE